MTFPKFEFLSPKTVDEVCAHLDAHGDKTMLKVGGTDLLIKMKARHIKPTYVLGLKGVQGLDELYFKAGYGLTIGATALLVSVAAHGDVQKYYPSLAYAAKETATVQIRNMGSVVANVCNASPSADTVPSLIALDAIVNIKNSGGDRQLPLKDFFTGPGKTVLELNEFVTSIFVPEPSEQSGNSYQHISARSKVDIPAACVGASIIVKDNRITDARIALGAVGPVVFRAAETESLLEGQLLVEDLLEKVGETASREAKPISDVRASAEYRTKMIAVLTKRAVKEAFQRATTV